MEEALKNLKETPKEEKTSEKKSSLFKKGPKFIYGLIILFLISNIVVFLIILGQQGFFGREKNVSLDLVENLDDLDLEGVNTNSAVSNENANTNTNTNININTNTNTSSKVEVYKSTGLGLTLGIRPPYQIATGVKAKEEFFQAVTYDDTQAGTEAGVGLKIEITREANSENLSLLEWAAQHEATDEPSVTFSETKIDGKDALEREVLTNFEAQRTIYVIKNKRVYIISISGDRDSYNTYLDTTQAVIDSISFTK